MDKALLRRKILNQKNRKKSAIMESQMCLFHKRLKITALLWEK